MRQIPFGAKGSFSLLVQPEHLADRFKDAILPSVFATPVMIMVMENAALNAIRAYLDSGESAVGTAVNVRHLAATLVGRLVTGEAEVTKIEGRQIEFTVRELRVPRRSGPARIPGLSSTWPNLCGGSNEQCLARHRHQSGGGANAGWTACAHTSRYLHRGSDLHNIAEQPARLQLDNRSLLTERKPAYKRGYIMAASLAIAGGIFRLVAYFCAFD
jgi:fluoroacetyl-CoA thioesterase